MHTMYAPCMCHARPWHVPGTSQVGSTAYELQEIYGIEGQAADGAGGSEDDFDDGDEKTRSECVISMTDPHRLHPLHSLTPRTLPYTPLPPLTPPYTPSRPLTHLTPPYTPLHPVHPLHQVRHLHDGPA